MTPARHGRALLRHATDGRLVTVPDAGHAAPIERPAAVAAAGTGQAQRAGFEFALEEINAAGGVLGEPLRIIIEDTQATPAVGLAAFEKRMTEDGVEFIAGGFSSGVIETYAAAEARAVYAMDMAFDDFDEVTAKHVSVKPVVLDVTDGAAVKAAVERIRTDEGPIDVLVNNAGITRDNLVQKMTDDEWNAVIGVNLTGNVGQSNYAAATGGVVSLTKTWAKEFARKGAKVRVNAIAPGFIRTPMPEKVPDKILEAMTAKTLLGRMGEPRDVANAALWLASDASSYVTAQVIGVDGGLVI